MHLRTKRKSATSTPENSPNIVRLILSVVFVFIILGFIYSFSNFAKTFKFNFNSLVSKNTKNEVVEDVKVPEVWVLNSNKSFFTKDGHQIFIQIATTTQDLVDGLSWKDKLKVFNDKEKIVTEGMLFDFGLPMIEKFWMKDMTFDLDMIWLDENYKIVHIEKNALASSYNSQDPDSAQLFANEADHLARYVLEINAGLVDQMNLKEGDTLKFQ